MSEPPPAARVYPARLIEGGTLGMIADFIRGVRIALIVFLSMMLILGFGLAQGGIVVLSLFAVLFILGTRGALSRLFIRTPKVGQVELVGRRLRFSSGGRGRVDHIALDRLQSALVVPEAEGSRLCQLVLLGMLGQRTVLGFDDLEEARALLHEMQMSPREVSSRFYFFFGLYVTVGADGVLLRWPLLGRQRFVPYAKILSVTSYFGYIELRLTGGDTYEIMTTTSQGAAKQQQHQALLERIAHACVSYRADHGDDRAALLDRSGRSAVGWIKDLGLLGQGGSGYRVAALPADTLWDVALDPAAKEETRIGAALALRSALDPEGREKLRIAAEASASPRVRVALDATADELTDEQLGEALDQAMPPRRA